MSLLLLFTGRAGTLQTIANVLTFALPSPTLVFTSAALVQPTPQVLALSAPTPTGRESRVLPTPVLSLSLPTPTLRVSGIARIAPAPQVLALSLAAPGLTIDVTIPIIIIGGVFRTDVLRKSLTISDIIDEQPNTCTFVIDGGPKPPVGVGVQIGIGSQLNLEFAGHITRIEQTYEGKRENVRWQCEAIDYTRLLDRRFVYRRYPAQSATTTVLDLIASFTSGFVTAHVATGLPVIDPIDFTWEEPTRALTRIAKLIGGYWYVDYNRSVHFFINETADAPDDITDVQLEVRALATGNDLSQVRTRVIVEGYGSTVLTDIPPGSIAIPVEDAVYFDPAGGLAKSGPQRLTYTAKNDGGQTTVVRGADGPVGPAGAPLPSVYGPGGGVYGTVYYAVSYRTAAGETRPGPLSVPVTGIQFPEPSGGFLNLSAAGVGQLIGSYNYRTTFVSQLGETTAGSAPPTYFTAQGVADPSTAPGVTFGPTAGPLVGVYSYVQTIVTALGETMAGARTQRTCNAIARPSSGPSTGGSGVWGNLRPGSYSWAFTYGTDLGETLISNVSSASIATWTPNAPSFNSSVVSTPGVPTGTHEWAVQFVDANGGVSNLSAAVRVTLSTNPQTVFINIPAGPAGTVARRMYRRAPFGDAAGITAFRFVGDQTDNTASYYTDAAPVAGTIYNTQTATMGQSALIQTFGLPSGVVRHRIYRSKLNTSSPLYLVGELVPSGSGTQSFIDNVPDSALTTLAPAVATAGGESLSVTIYTGASPQTAARRLYRTKADGFQYFLHTEIPGNASNQTIVDRTPDAGLTGGAPPYVNSAGGQSIRVANIPGGPSGTIARRIYRSFANDSASWHLAAELSDNFSSSFVDNKADTELGSALPLFNDAGASVIQIANLPIGPSYVTARRLYRTMNNGALLYFAAEIHDNTTTVVYDDRSDKELGDVAPTSSSVGALPGDTVLRVASIPFPTGGWLQVGNQLILFLGLDPANLLVTNIPASGPGSITAPIRVGDDVVQAPVILGVPSSGVGSILYTIQTGDPINVLVERDDLAAQAAIKAIEGGDGVHEHFVQDDRLTIASCRNRADAELKMFATAEQRLTFTSRDPKLRSGKTLVVNIGPPNNIAGTFKIQQVIISAFDIPGQLPLREVTASNYLYSLEHLLRRVELGD